MKKKILSIIMSVMVMITFIPCIAFAEGDAGKIDLANATVYGVQDMVPTPGDLDSEFGVCQPTTSNENEPNQWNWELDYVTLTIEGKSRRVEQLIQNEDFTVSYKNNKALGTATIIFTAKDGGDFTGSISETFEIEKYAQEQVQADFSSMTTKVGGTITLDVPKENQVVGTNVGFDHTRSVTTNSTNLQASFEKEYIVEDGYVDPITYYRYKITASKTGTYKLTIHCYGNEMYYERAKDYSITVQPKAQEIKVTNWKIGKYTYDGNAKKPNPVVKSGSKTLKKNTDYTVSYKNNVAASTSAEVIVEGKGKYSGTLPKYFTISKGTQTIDVKVSSSVLAPGGKTATIKQTPASKTRNVGVFSYKSSNTNVVNVKRDAYHNCVVTSVGKGTAIVTVTAKNTDNLNAATKKITFTVKDSKSKTAISKNMVLFTYTDSKGKTKWVTDISKLTFKKKQYPDVTMFPNKKARDKALKNKNTAGKLKYNTDWSFSYNTKGKTLTVCGAGNYYGKLTYKYNTK